MPFSKFHSTVLENSELVDITQIMTAKVCKKCAGGEV
jgi:hypothetical protein